MSIDPERLKVLLSSPLLDDILLADLSKVNRDELRKTLGLDQIEFELLIDYEQTLEQMIVVGRYDWFNSKITAEHFPIKGEGKISRKVEIIKLNWNMCSDEVIAELDKIGKRPAAIEDLLAFGAQYPDIQRQFPVVALGSSAEVSNYLYAECLYMNGSRRCLDFCWWDDVAWYHFYRFLVFDK